MSNEGFSGMLLGHLCWTLSVGHCPYLCLSKLLLMIMKIEECGLLLCFSSFTVMTYLYQQIW